MFERTLTMCLGAWKFAPTLPVTIRQLVRTHSNHITRTDYAIVAIVHTHSPCCDTLLAVATPTKTYLSRCKVSIGYYSRGSLCAVEEGIRESFQSGFGGLIDAIACPNTIQIYFLASLQEPRKTAWKAVPVQFARPRSRYSRKV